VGLAAETVGEGLVGYLLCRLYGDMWHVMNLAVAPGQRRRGTGRLLMQRFLGLADATRSVSTLEVRPSNRSAVRLYAGLGFEFVGRRRGYYTDTGEDALVMTRPVGRKEVQAVR
jgi:ribosomal-protein-alanine N-acetyltransferase